MKAFHKEEQSVLMALGGEIGNGGNYFEFYSPNGKRFVYISTNGEFYDVYICSMTDNKKDSYRLSTLSESINVMYDFLKEATK